MDYPQLTTELEAVNATLASVGESPIVTLDNAFVDAELARDLIRQTSRATQQRGWQFNTDLAWELVPDNLGRIFTPPNLLLADIADTNIVVRGNQLYDRSRHSYIFEAPVTMARAVTFLDFEQCPEAMRRFVYVSAGRRFQDRYQGGEVLHQIQKNDEVAAWAALWDYEAAAAKFNVLSGSTLMQRVRQNR